MINYPIKNILECREALSMPVPKWEDSALARITLLDDNVLDVSRDSLATPTARSVNARQRPDATKKQVSPHQNININLSCHK